MADSLGRKPVIPAGAGILLPRRSPARWRRLSIQLIVMRFSRFCWAVAASVVINAPDAGYLSKGRVFAHDASFVMLVTTIALLMAPYCRRLRW